MSSLVKVAVAQLKSTSDKAVNFATLSRLASEAAANNATFLFLPEVCNFMSSSAAQTLSNAELLPSVGATPPHSTSTSLAHLSDLATEHSLWISGTLHEQVSTDRTKVYNTHVILDPSGTLKAKYRKIHLFDIDIPTASPPVKLLESNSTTPGDAATLLHNTPLGTIGLATCYDIRFSSLADTLRYAGGADVLLYPSAFTLPTGRQLWEPLLRARAAETQTFVIASAQVGIHNEKRRSFGHAIVANPWGETIADAGGWDADREVETLPAIEDINVYADIDMSLIARVRTSIPVTNHRRSNLTIENFF